MSKRHAGTGTITKTDIKDLAKEFKFTAKISGYRGWKFRPWIATQLIRLAGWVIWADVKFELPGEDD